MFEHDPTKYLDKYMEDKVAITEEEDSTHASDLHLILGNFPPVSNEGDSRPTEPGEYELSDFEVKFNFAELDPDEFLLDNTKKEFIKYLFKNTDEIDPEIKPKISATLLISEAKAPRVDTGDEDDDMEKILEQKMYDPTSPNRARELMEFKFKNKYSDGEIDLSKLPQHGVKVIFNPDAAVGGNFDPDSRKIFLRGDITNLETLLVLLHEVGHVAALSSMGDEQVARFFKLKGNISRAIFEGGGEATNEDAAFFIQAERDAWAFALKQIKKLFVTRDERIVHADIIEVVNKFIHEYTLRKNSESVRKALDPDFNGLTSEFLAEKGLTREELKQIIYESIQGEEPEERK